jgi:hypothetical protein
MPAASCKESGSSNTSAPLAVLDGDCRLSAPGADNALTDAAGNSTFNVIAWMGGPQYVSAKSMGYNVTASRVRWVRLCLTVTVYMYACLNPKLVWNCDSDMVFDYDYMHILMYACMLSYNPRDCMFSCYTHSVHTLVSYFQKSSMGDPVIRCNLSL